MKVTFWGTRGSTPCPSDENARYGGNTACVTVHAQGMDPIVLDLGTGFRFYGRQVMNQRHVDSPAFRALVLVTHLHWDHVQGLPFFDPVHLPDTHLIVRGRADEGTLEEAFSEFMRPPYFPIRAAELIGAVDFVDCDGESFKWGPATVSAGDVPHTGATNGYRIEVEGRSVAYISDHQQPQDTSWVPSSVLDLCRDADLVIHDAQYRPEEFRQRAHWGHCTVEYAVEVAAQAGAKRLALFHHDPSHCDEIVDEMLQEARERANGTSIQEVIAAYEGLTVELTPKAD